jgi:hypothetical protein
VVTFKKGRLLYHKVTYCLGRMEGVKSRRLLALHCVSRTPKAQLFLCAQTPEHRFPNFHSEKLKNSNWS